ncbi:hypothetical protein [Variovorax sp. 160MFSha2.1]|uniref:hypothetical protein n=1 Tax=Variovorax sp. 160MFSha2.1 TaxID=3158367 RepID=UPI003AAEA194
MAHAELDRLQTVNARLFSKGWPWCLGMMFEATYRFNTWRFEMTQEIVAAREVGNGVLPVDVEAAIKKAVSQGDLFSVTGVRAFGDQVLKAGVVTFQPGAKLILTDYSHPWIALVTQQMQFVDTNTVATLLLSMDWHPQSYGAPPAPAKPAKANKGDVTQVGANGANGAPGSPGQQGDHAPATPKIYIVCGGVADKQSKPIPAAMTLAVLADGYSGGNGSGGGNGGAGGDGGDGGDGQMGQPWEGCKHSASDGGPGGVGGAGGSGGAGGNAASGAEIVLIGPEASWVSLSYAAFQTRPGHPGEGGYSGASGPSGAGGVRGSHPGTCSGGSSGATPATPATPHVKAVSGSDGRVGMITKVKDDDIARFF